MKTIAIGGVLWMALLFFVAWLIWLALGVVLPAFGLRCPSYWVVFCGWFLLGAIGKAFRKA